MEKAIENRKYPRSTKKFLITNLNAFHLENPSSKGAMLVGNENLPNEFELEIKLNSYKKIAVKCLKKWKNKNSIGVEFLEKNDLFSDLINTNIEKEKKWGKRVYAVSKQITLTDTNSFGNVYFAKHFEMHGFAREKLMLHHISNLATIIAQTGYRLATIDAQIKYFNEAFFGDELVIEVTTKNLKASEATLIFTIKRPLDNTTISIGSQRVCCLNAQGKVIKIPEIFDYLEFYETIE